MRMLYSGYQAWNDMLAPARLGAEWALGLRKTMGPMAEWAMPRRMFALMDVFQGAKLTHKRPAYDINLVQSGNAQVAVREEVALDMPFGNLLHFVKDDVAVDQPRVLVVAPMSGHFSTLLRNTVETLLRDHDVYITDWKNARDVPLSAGRFGFDDYVDYVIRFLQELGEGAHLVSVCQPCVPAMAAVALMSEDQDKATPRSMTLMGGPIDPNAAPTAVNDLANEKPIKWFEENLISVVPFRYAGRGREVYPGFLQLSAFVSMNMARHGAQHRELYQLLADGKTEQADKIKTFYEEYFAVHDMTKEFYLETVDMVFQRTLLAKGELTVRGRKIDLGAIRKTALLTVEGERDDVCAVGQTSAAHALCTGLRPHLKRHHLQPGVGHYGVFSGSKWEKQVYPQVRNMILAMN
ncbi:MULTISPECIES: polyhydroxyalkanoate depolymerase [Sphingobium]|jgi:polyhydroxyalkanoate depolymerase|uniref:Polyhydroxyalkanoate depolymerase n=1 Tax=Sphingobium soli TaxID=1591116 RepID=A0ABS8H349_9SPHN|nr:MULTISPECIES: polyhydroxyalkanoate depolymerase [Sphingobium]MEE2741259.1 polyhydroxyalkanoate depolymerase [Pseudomonadota bacterium]MBA38771.1 poly(3-hydroxybutyrate) depolymerase [Sphingobium sp.]MBS46609.1 poly(3-hydroxybutyrate) depolymerase [Sphingobium sp.]MCC4232965.1 polyhydroxyalkanoate depolymerase [Sphingobium soli]MCC4257447.1 polyhydroxyalkanoate depolymerase [Sphingobium lactosutens]|tara:strand:- start:229 stop:1452 length:1224 start_codon:yes stop_codon:yes gene_type:complete